MHFNVSDNCGLCAAAPSSNIANSAAALQAQWLPCLLTVSAGNTSFSEDTISSYVFNSPLLISIDLAGTQIQSIFLLKLSKPLLHNIAYKLTQNFILIILLFLLNFSKFLDEALLAEIIEQHPILKEMDIENTPIGALLSIESSKIGKSTHRLESLILQRHIWRTHQKFDDSELFSFIWQPLSCVDSSHNEQIKIFSSKTDILEFFSHLAEETDVLLGFEKEIASFIKSILSLHFKIGDLLRYLF